MSPPNFVTAPIKSFDDDISVPKTKPGASAVTTPRIASLFSIRTDIRLFSPLIYPIISLNNFTRASPTGTRTLS